MKKGQKQEQTTEIDEKEKIIDKAEAEEDDDDDDWFKVKTKSDALEEATIDLPEPLDKEKRLTKAQLAKKLRKKNLLINKRIEYDEEGNVSNQVLMLLINSIILFLIRQLFMRMKKINLQRIISKKQKLGFNKRIKQIKKHIEL